jgi:hypothetical protein
MKAFLRPTFPIVVTETKDDPSTTELVGTGGSSESLANDDLISPNRGDSRSTVPFIVKIQCPHCGKPVEISLDDLPQDELVSAWSRWRARQRQTIGGLYWLKHNPNTSRCRCKACMKKRYTSEQLATMEKEWKAGKRKRSPKPAVDGQ